MLTDRSTFHIRGNSSGVWNTVGVTSVADSDPGSGMGKSSGSGMNIPDQISESLEKFFWV
jgi:hypothetical protein